MTDDTHRVTTEERHDRLNAARRHGGICGACERLLDPDEPVYWERFVVTIERSVGGRASRYRTTVEAPVGRACASHGFLRETEGREPGRCGGCGRGVYYRVSSRRRHLAVCSRTCRDRAVGAERTAKRRSAR